MTTVAPQPTEIDPPKVEAFAERLMGTYVTSIVGLMIDVGHKAGLFEAAAQGPATSEELAERAGLQERSDLLHQLIIRRGAARPRPCPRERRGRSAVPVDGRP